MNVSAVIVTRGDVDLTEIVFSLPEDCELLIWNNGSRRCGRYWAGLGKPEEHSEFYDVADLAVYGRYAAIEHTSGDLIYVQDDDVVLPPESIREIIETWSGKEPTVEELAAAGVIGNIGPTGPRGPVVVANMPQPFRHDFYSDHCLVGFGAVFHRDAFDRAMNRFANGSDEAAAILAGSRGHEELMWWRRTCDIVFTGLTPRILVDVEYQDLPWAEDESRMYRQPEHVEERARMLELVRQVRDAA